MTFLFVRRMYCAALLLLAAPAVLCAQAATGTIRGKVTDVATGRGLADAQIQLVGTRLGTVSLASGDYTLSGVPTGARVVQFRRIGFQPISRTIQVVGGATATINAPMAVSAINLSEVVVTGSASPTEKRRVGTSIATVDSTVFSKAQAVTVDLALQGKIAGAQISQNSGGPGGGGISIRLRGTNSFIAGSDPLYIVDGVIIDNGSAQLTDLGGRANPQNRLADLNPNDIERIEILRGAAAGALYGSRANNGVVQIFTKKGVAGKPRVTFSTRLGSNELREQQPFNFYPNDINGLPIARYNLQDDIFRRAPTYEQNLSLEGGSDATRYFISLNALEDQGIIRSTEARRQGARINVQQQITPKLLANVSTNLISSRNQFQAFGEQNDYGIMGSLFFAPTQTDFRPRNGIYPLPPALGTNPLLAIERIKNPQTINRFIGSAKLTYTPTAKLLIDFTAGVDNSAFEQGQFIPRGAVLGTGLLSTGQSQSVFQNTRVLNQDAVATYSWNPGSKIEWKTTAGLNYTQQTINITQSGANGLAPVGELVSAGSLPFGTQRRLQLRTLGYFGVQELGLYDKLFFSAALRLDASSTFAPAQRWQAFPKFDVSYVALENRPGLLNSVRLRSAIGWAGSQPGAANAYSQFVTYSQSAFGGRPGFVNDVTFGNPDLKNEIAREFEVGTEVGLLGGRVGVEATYYDRLVSDLLFFKPLPTSTGFSRQFAPIGTMSNKGIELLVRAVPMDRKNLRWESTVTYTRNRNLVESLIIPDFQSAGGYPNRIRTGEPAGVFYGSYAARNCVTGALLLDSLGRYRRSNIAADMGANVAARQALSGGTCNDSSVKVIGDPNPDWLGSLLNEFTIGKKLRLRALFDGTFGNQILNLSTRAQNAGVASNSKEYERELLPYGDPRKLPPGFNARTQGIFEYWVEDGSFVKLRELSASYTLDWKPVKRIFREGVDLTVSGRNLWVWTKYSGYDPEVSVFGTNAGGLGSGQTTAADRGIDFGAYPIPRVWSVSARFTY